MDKKRKQLGMNPSTASNRLVKDVLFKFVQLAGHKCHQCGEELTRETFSIEHIEPWLDSDDPAGVYFDLNNITFSHQGCNSGARRGTLAAHGTKRRYGAHGCRCEKCAEANRNDCRQRYTPEKRRERYLRTGR